VRKIRPTNFRLLFVLFLLCAISLTSCSPFYILRAAYEESKILWRREPIEKALEKPDLDPETRDKFKLVLEVREYARDRLKLNVGGSYASYSYIDRPDLTYVVTAAPKTELRPYTWWFLIIRHVPYKGFFYQEDAKAEAERLESDGYDTYIRTSPAFSTLGWFDDPLLTHLLKYDKVTLAAVIFHELFHNTLYVAGAGDFNESLANFVGGRAAISFFRDRYGEGSAEHARAVQAWEEEVEFSRFVRRLAESLQELYAKDLPTDEKLRLKEEILSRGRAEWSKQTAARPQHRFRGFGQMKVNNAVMIHFRLYLKELELFEALYDERGRDLPQLIGWVKGVSWNGREPFEVLRLELKKQ
jgi:predicted aminopeptidase